MNLIAPTRDGQMLTAAPLRVGRLLDRLLDPITPTAGTETWFPRMDVLETAEALEVMLDLPGINPDDVEVNVHEDQLVISGSRPAPETSKDVRWYRFERHSGAFHRSLSLPFAVEKEKAEARFENGQLYIRLPKLAAALPKRLEIQGG